MVCVTGAAGHIGNVLVRELLERGETVRALLLPGEDRSSLEGLAVEFMEGNVLDPAALQRAFAGANTVYHLAGVISILPGRNDLMRAVNVEGTKNVARTARTAGVKRLVFTSSIHAIGRPPNGVPIDESCPFDPSNPAGEYDRTKAEASLAVLDEVRQGLDAVIVCPTGIIGPFDFRESEIGSLMRAWGRRGAHVFVKGQFDFADVRDVVRGMILAAEKGRTGGTYILGGERVTVRRLLELVREATGLRGPAVKVSYRLAHWAAPVIAWVSRLRGKKVLFTRYSLETLQENSMIRSDKAQRELGYAPRPLIDTVRDTIAWWRTRVEALGRIGVPIAVAVDSRGLFFGAKKRTSARSKEVS